jgi:hypothetical protein
MGIILIHKEKEQLSNELKEHISKSTWLVMCFEDEEDVTTAWFGVDDQIKVAGTLMKIVTRLLKTEDHD